MIELRLKIVLILIIPISVIYPRSRLCWTFILRWHFALKVRRGHLFMLLMTVNIRRQNTLDILLNIIQHLRTPDRLALGAEARRAECRPDVIVSTR
jgi:hypothetical protein